MKLKAVISPNLPVRFARALITPELNGWYLETVIVGCLHVPRSAVHPATHYIQWPDFMVQYQDDRLGVEVSFSKLSARFDRSGKDFEMARQAVREKFKDLIEQNLPTIRSCGLFIGSQTDKETEGPDGSWKTLHELDMVEVFGRATDSDPELETPAGDFSLKPFRSRNLFSTTPGIRP